jgi:hypothetical protein
MASRTAELQAIFTTVYYPRTAYIRLCFKGVVDFFEKGAERLFQKNQQHL